jgi:fructose-bisphosphate aldolase class I
MSERLEDIAAAIVADGRSLLAADESSGTIKKRFDVMASNPPPTAAATIAR